MKHDSTHRAALYLNPRLVDNIASSVQMTGNGGHEPVPTLKTPVLPYPQVTPLDAPGALGSVGEARYEPAFNLAQVILFDATGGKEYPRSPESSWNQRLAYLYGIYGHVSRVAITGRSLLCRLVGTSCRADPQHARQECLAVRV